jgi:hypothetical protein
VSADQRTIIGDINVLTAIVQRLDDSQAAMLARVVDCVRALKEKV